MYVPKHFAEERIDVLHRTMRDIAVATIVSNGPGGLIASHVPIELDDEPTPHGTVFCHFAKSNPHASAIAGGGEVLLIFQGPQGYITPSWYPTKRETGKVVPTWNYVAIHAYGEAAVYDDPARLRRHLAALTAHNEAAFAEPWGLDDAPDEFIAGMVRGILGVEIRLERIEGKWKMSQNRGEADRAGVVDGLRARGDDASRSMAALVARADED